MVIANMKKYSAPCVNKPILSRKMLPVVAQSGCRVRQRTTKRITSRTNMMIPKIM